MTTKNKKLFELLEEYIKEYSYENYTKVASELINGDAELLIPQYRANPLVQGSHTTVKGEKIDLGIYFVDGLKAIAAFTSEEALLSWAKKPTKYIAMTSKIVLQICDENDIRRIVIDSKLRTMFFLQRGG